MLDTVSPFCDLSPIMSEIFTLDSRGRIQASNIIQNSVRTPAQTFTIGKIYREDGSSGTGFLVGRNHYGPIILTCKHVAIETFTEQHFQSWICFDEDQSSFSIEADSRSHQCGRFYCLRLLDVASKFDDPYSVDVDPITLVHYSVELDAALFVLENTCRCMKTLNYPQLNYVPLTLEKPPTEISIHGFLGDINSRTAPLTDISPDEILALKRNLREGVFSISHGEILAVGDLCAITCPTTAGFSGSPVLAEYSGGDFKAWGLFISGPSLPEHEFFIRLVRSYLNDKNDAQSLLTSLDSSRYSFAALVSAYLFIEFSHTNIFVPKVMSAYGSTIYEYRRNGFMDPRQLNHNLCIPFYRLAGFLRKNGISL